MNSASLVNIAVDIALQLVMDLVTIPAVGVLGNHSTFLNGVAEATWPAGVHASFLHNRKKKAYIVSRIKPPLALESTAKCTIPSNTSYFVLFQAVYRFVLTQATNLNNCWPVGLLGCNIEFEIFSGFLYIQVECMTKFKAKFLHTQAEKNCTIRNSPMADFLQ